jgi:CubicO group peptidase (beta-lactamase class C family)
MLTKVRPELQRTPPESQGIPSSSILKFVEAIEQQIKEVHSFMLLRHGKVVAEGWWSPYQRTSLHMLFSLSKSFTSTAVGLAVAEGLFSIDDTVMSHFPDEIPAKVSKKLAAMRVRHLLSMSTGQAIDTMPAMFSRRDLNWVKGFFTVPVLHKPGTHFVYNTGATYMLSALVQKKSGMKLNDYLASRLYEPLGIDHAIWDESPQQINMGGFGLNLTTEDIARFGQLYLQKGEWQGRRILSEAWIAEATAFHSDNSSWATIDWTQGYGYQFWRCQHNAYRVDGAFGQYCIVMPEQDAVLAITGGLGDMQQPLTLVWDILLPAMDSKTLPADAVTHNTLTDRLSSLSIPPVQGAVSSPTAGKIAGRTYKFDTNPLKLKTIAFDMTASGCTVRVKTPAADDCFTCGYDIWHAGKISMFNEPWVNDPAPHVASAAWTAEDTLTVVIRLPKTPFVYTFVCQFAGDQLTIEAQINVSFDPVKAWTLVAHAR